VHATKRISGRSGLSCIEATPSQVVLYTSGLLGRAEWLTDRRTISRWPCLPRMTAPSLPTPALLYIVCQPGLAWRGLVVCTMPCRAIDSGRAAPRVSAVVCWLAVAAAALQSALCVCMCMCVCVCVCVLVARWLCSLPCPTCAASYRLNSLPPCGLCTAQHTPTPRHPASQPLLFPASTC